MILIDDFAGEFSFMASSMAAPFSSEPQMSDIIVEHA
jgi:hypothetical protein